MSSAIAEDFGKVAVLMGGWSAEREISLNSGAAVFRALVNQGVDALAIDAQQDLFCQLVDKDIQRVFNILHGRGGEDGVVQGVLECMGLPYTGSGVRASAIAMDKIATKLMWRGLGLPTPEFLIVNEDMSADVIVAQLGLPLIIKPALEGSSIGMSRVTDVAELPAALTRARETGGPILAERWVNGSEYTVGILQGQALPAIRLQTPRDFYDYEAKYKATDTQYHCPCGLSIDDEAVLQDLALKAFYAVGASGWGRVDVMQDTDGSFYLIEVNTVPGMTDHSLVPMAANVAGLDFEALVLRILETSFDKQ